MGYTDGMRGRTALGRAYRSTGADLPGGDPRPSHGAEMEGYFWRFTDTATGRVVVALCGVNKHPDGDWATVAVAVDPGGVVRSAAVDDAWAATDRFNVRAGQAFDYNGATGRLRVVLDDCALDVTVDERFEWPLRLGGGGLFSAVPFLNQYWHPYLLGGRASGTVAVAGETREFDGAQVYAEKNWGKGFPRRWWWGQAHGFERDDVSVAFSGGVLELGPLAKTVGGVVVRIGSRVLRWTPPFSVVRSSVDDGLWRVRAAGLPGRVFIDGDGAGREPHVLPVPLPAERRNVDTDFEHLAGRLTLRVESRGRVLFRGTSELAGLEVGSRP